MDAAANVIIDVSLVANASPDAMPNRSAHVPGLIFGEEAQTHFLSEMEKMKPVAAQNIIAVNAASSISWMKSVAKKANMGDVARIRTNVAARNRPAGIFLNILDSARKEKAKAIKLKARGVHRRSVLSSAARELFPAAFWIVAAA